MAYTPPALLSRSGVDNVSQVLGGGVRQPGGGLIMTPAEEQAALQRDIAASNRARGMGLAARALDTGAADQSRGTQGEQIARVNAAGGNVNTAAGNVAGVGQQYQDFAAQGPGPSAAEAQLAQTTDASMRQQLALAGSGRGLGGNVAMRQAGVNQAAAMGQAGGQLALLRAQEADAWRSRQLEALGGASSSFANSGQLYNAEGGLYNAGGGLATQQRAGDIGQQGEQTKFMAANDQGMLGWEDAAANRQGMNLDLLSADANQKAMFEALATGQQGEAMRLWQAGEDKKRAIQAAREDAALQGTMAAGEALVKLSDRDLKTNIQPTKLAEALADIPAESYEYKDEKHGKGRFVGPMAQDLERIGLGSTVIQTREGKAVDTGRLALATVTAVAEQARDLKRLKAALELS